MIISAKGTPSKCYFVYMSYHTLPPCIRQEGFFITQNDRNLRECYRNDMEL